MGGYKRGIDLGRATGFVLGGERGGTVDLEDDLLICIILGVSRRLGLDY